MPITHYGSKTSPNSWNANTNMNNNSCTIDAPDSVPAGTFMLAWIIVNDQTVTAPSGWTLYSNSLHTGGNFRSYVYYKVATGSEPANYTFTVPTNDSPMCGAISSWTGVDPADPINTGAVTNSVLAVQTSSTPNVTTTERALILYFRAAVVTSDVTSVLTFNPPTINRSFLVGERGGSTRYYCEQYRDGSTVVAPGSQSGISFSCKTNGGGNITPVRTIERTIALREYVAPATPTPPKGDVAATAYGTGNDITTTATQGPVTVAAYNPTALPGIEATNVPQGSVSVAAYNPTVVFTGLAEAGATAYNAVAAVGASAGKGDVTASALNSVGYFGAPRERKYMIPKEDRTLRAYRGKKDRG